MFNCNISGTTLEYTDICFYNQGKWQYGWPLLNTLLDCNKYSYDFGELYTTTAAGNTVIQENGKTF